MQVSTKERSHFECTEVLDSGPVFLSPFWLRWNVFHIHNDNMLPMYAQALLWNISADDMRQRATHIEFMPADTTWVRFACLILNVKETQQKCDTSPGNILAFELVVFRMKKMIHELPVLTCSDISSLKLWAT